jgi:hypothetical protein
LVAFNRGRPFHGSEHVAKGGLKGTADTDYFYFFCPRCPDQYIMRVIDFKIVKDGPVEYAKELSPAAHREFIIALELHCQNCGHDDFVKIANMGWQGGNIAGSPGFGNEAEPQPDVTR